MPARDTRRKTKLFTKEHSMKTMLTIALLIATFNLTMAVDTCFAKKRRDMICVAEKVEGRQVTL